MELLEFFATRPVFNYEEFADFLDKKGSRNVKTRRRLLQHHTQSGRLLRVRRGLFVTVPPGSDPKTFQADPYLLAAKMTPDAALAYHTALEFWGKAYSVREEFAYLTRSVTRPVTFRGQRFHGLLFPRALREKRQEFFAVKVADRSGLDVRVTNLERTMVDVFDRPDLGGGWEEIWRSLESVEFFDLDQVADYALLLGNSTTVAKVGFYLEQHRAALMLDDVHLDRLRARKPKSAHYMTQDRRLPARFVPAWNLIVPREVLERSWEESQ